MARQNEERGLMNTPHEQWLVPFDTGDSVADHGADLAEDVIKFGTRHTEP